MQAAAKTISIGLSGPYDISRIPDVAEHTRLVAAFDHLGGFALYVQDGKLKHHYSMLGVLEYTQEAETTLPTGELSVEMVFAADAPTVPGAHSAETPISQ